MATKKNNTNVFKEAASARNMFAAPSMTVGGNIVAPNSNGFTLNMGYQKISKAGGTSKISNVSAMDEVVESILNAFGCSVCYEAKEFSLLESQTDEEIIQNENIIDPESLKKIQNKNDTVEDKFPNSADPFYTFDEAIPNTTKEDIKSINSMDQKPNLETLIVEIVKVNLSPNGTTTKYFK